MNKIQCSPWVRNKRICKQRAHLVFLFFLILFFLFNLNYLYAAENDFTQLSIEELMDIKVTSVSKKSQNLSNSAAAVFVITNDDLKRSGMTTIPDALRMVPGVNVARIDSNKWAVSCRGFNGRFASKLLVLIDGRSIYSPSFSGVYWENNDVMMEDIDRIEVIRGPGATLWGANAVNGVINIITKNSKDTKGGILIAGTGNQEKVISGFRYGSSIGKDTNFRIYAKHSEKGEFKSVNGGDAGDYWRTVQSGFRMDSTPTTKDNFTFEGDIFHDNVHQDLYLVKNTPPFMGNFPVETLVSGGNMSTRWQHTLSLTSDMSLMIYYDTTRRSKDFYDEKRDNINMEFQHHFAAGDNNDIIWGVRYRYTHGDFSGSSPAIVEPVKKHDDLYSIFLRDEISFLDKSVHLTVGSKFEHNDYTGFEAQPGARLMWKINSGNKIWAAVSRAVRTPAITETDATLPYSAFDSSAAGGIPGIPLVVDFIGDKNFKSEKLTAYELGYRFIPAKSFSVDAAIFYNDYDNLRTAQVTAPHFTGISFVQDLIFDNNLNGKTWGGELAAAFRMSKFFKCNLAYSFLKTDLNGKHAGGFPKHQVSIRGEFDLTKTIELNTWLRYVNEYSTTYISSSSVGYQIDNYFTMDLQLRWKITPKIELSLAGQNLLEGHHVEFVQESFSKPVETEHSFYGKLTFNF